MKLTRQSGLELAVAVLRKAGSPLSHSQEQADVLVEAELRGHPSHGLQRLPRLALRIAKGLADPTTSGDFRWRTSSFLEVDGLRGLGPVVALRACDRLIERARSTGIAVAGIRNTNHLGMLSPYVEHIAGAGLAGIAMSSSGALVHPHGGTSALLGTNPIAIAVPTSQKPLVVDLATSIVSMGKIHHHAANGLPIDSGWARDIDGRPTVDASRAISGSIAPFGDAKGYALGMALELLGASIARSSLAPDVRGTLDAEAVCNKGDVLIAVDAGSESDLLACFSAYLDRVRRSPPSNLATPVAVPGDGARSRRQQAIDDGFDVSDALWNELSALAQSTDAVAKGYPQ